MTSEPLFSETIASSRRAQLEAYLKHVEIEREDINQRRALQAHEVDTTPALPEVAPSVQQSSGFTSGWKHLALMLTFGGAIGQKM